MAALNAGDRVRSSEIRRELGVEMQLLHIWGRFYQDTSWSSPGLGEKSGPGVTVKPAHSIHGALPTQCIARIDPSGPQGIPPGSPMASPPLSWRPHNPGVDLELAGGITYPGWMPLEELGSMAREGFLGYPTSATWAQINGRQRMDGWISLMLLNTASVVSNDGLVWERGRYKSVGETETLFYVIHFTECLKYCQAIL